MQVLSLTPKSIDLAISLLERGGIVAHPTETCYGLACDLTNPTAVARLFAMKKRPLDQPVSALFPSQEKAELYSVWNDYARELAEKYLPGPLTLILPLRTDAPHQLHPLPTSLKRLTTIGVRISSHPLAQKLVEIFGKPISTTSANIHGLPATYSTEEMTVQFLDFTTDVLLLDTGPLPLSPPSTIIDLTGPSPHEVRRGTLHEPAAHDHDPQ